MPLTHDVIDLDTHFRIDPVTRNVSNPELKKTVLIKGDHNSERFTFDIPRYIEGHDMSLCNVVRIHFINVNSSTGARSTGVYEPDDYAINATDDEVCNFSWLVSQAATTHVGKLAFAIQFACTTDEELDYSWNTGICSFITISDGINNGEYIIEEYTDILESWFNKLYTGATLPVVVCPYEEFKDLGGNTQKNTLYLFEDDPTLEEIKKLAIDYDKFFSSKEGYTLVTDGDPVVYTAIPSGVYLVKVKVSNDKSFSMIFDTSTVYSSAFIFYDATKWVKAAVKATRWGSTDAEKMENKVTLSVVYFKDDETQPREVNAGSIYVRQFGPIWPVG